MTEEPNVELEFTPNPNTLKYSTNAVIITAPPITFDSPDKAKEKSELALELFKIDGVGGVMIARNFITVTLAHQDTLTELNEAVIKTLKNFIMSGREAVFKSAYTSSTLDPAKVGSIEAKIISILDEEIRPRVAMDGGDITFDRFENGLVFLHMKGSCAGCPSSTATLKMGIENRLRELIPEVTEVISV